MQKRINRYIVIMTSRYTGRVSVRIDKYTHSADGTRSVFSYYPKATDKNINNLNEAIEFERKKEVSFFADEYNTGVCISVLSVKEAIQEQAQAAVNHG